MEKKKTTKTKPAEKATIAQAPKKNIGTRGRIFQGTVIKKFPGRVVIEFERTIRIAKYERFAKKQSKIHAKLPESIKVEVGDLVKAQECRPISKIIHAVVISKVDKEAKK